VINLIAGNPATRPGHGHAFVFEAYVVTGSLEWAPHLAAEKRLLP
jgi:hypothetical protein